jgi:hypothetical protein
MRSQSPEFLLQGRHFEHLRTIIEPEGPRSGPCTRVKINLFGNRFSFAPMRKDVS